MRMAAKILIAAGLIGAAGGYGINTGVEIAQENMLHTEHFEAIVIDGEGFYGEPVDDWGRRISGEGVKLDVDFIPIDANEGDIVSVSWTQAQADNGDWATPAKVEIEADAEGEEK